MPVLTLAFAIAVAQTQSTSNVYKNLDAGIAFDCPKEWTLITEKPTKKKKKKSVEVTSYKLNLADAPDAKLDIFSLEYSGDPALWTSAQKDAATNMGRELKQTSQEEILGVPLLLVQTAWDNNGQAMTGSAGMLYARSAKKMLFRLESSTTTFPAAYASLKGALQSLRTLDGSLPKPEEPFRKPDPGEGKRRPQEPKIMQIEAPQATTKAQAINYSDKVEIAQLGGHGYSFSYPSAWSLNKAADGTMKLQGPQHLEGTLILASVLDSDNADAAYRKAWKKTLDDFSVVDDRLDGTELSSRQKALRWVIRTGKDAAGKPLQVFHAVGEGGDAYWLVSFTFSQPMSTEMRDELMKLIKSTVIEAKN